MSESVAFGVGCFNFGVKKSPPFTITGSRYISELTAALERVSNISEIKINASEEFLGLSRFVQGPFIPLDEGYDFFPSTDFDPEISFDLYIPRRVQHELSPLKPSPEIGTEKFKISMSRPLYLPVTFVEAIEPDKMNYPSEAVMIVREFLEKHINEPSSEYIRFESLGPSPFHANFFLKKEVQRSEDYPYRGFRCHRTPMRGDDRLEFLLDPAFGVTHEVAKKGLFRVLKDEIGVFYLITHMRNLRHRAWADLQSDISELVKAREKGFFRSLWQNLFSGARQIHDAFVGIAECEIEDMEGRTYLEQAYRGLFKYKTEPFLDLELKESMQEWPVCPANQLREIVTLLETRRSRLVEGFILLLSAILGGVVGSIITLLVSKE